MQKAMIAPHWSRRFNLRAVLVFSMAILPSAHAQASPTYAQPLATGVRLDPVGDFIDLGSMPLSMAIAPAGDKLAVVLSGWREQGLQIVDLKSRKVLQTLTQPSAFLGIAFSRDGRARAGSGPSARCRAKAR